MKRFERHIQVGAGDASTIDLLTADTGLSRQAIKAAMGKGAVWLARCGHIRRLRRLDSRPHPGDEIHLYYDEAVLGQEPVEPTLIADEGSFSIWFKPFGVLSQGSKWGDHCTLGRWAERHLEPQRPAFAVHRLDRATTGLMIIAHGKRTASAFAERFRKRLIDKRYTAIVHGKAPLEATIDNRIDGRSAISHILRTGYDTRRRRSLVEIRIETGRKHQIRRHLSGLGCPVVGDRLYGRVGDSEDLQLCATSLHFRSPADDAERHYSVPDILRPTLD